GTAGHSRVISLPITRSFSAIAAQLRLLKRSIHRLDQIFFRPLPIPPPIRGPNPVNPPPQPLQYRLPQPVPVPRGRGAMVTRSIALDPQHVASRFLRRKKRQIDSITGTTDLRVQRKSLFSQKCRHLGFENRIVIIQFRRLDRRRECPRPPLRVFKIGLQLLRASRPSP